ncbi:hypothetical protein PTKIN_Ptkin11bG0203300 [Pterospermum kingtungense]
MEDDWLFQLCRNICSTNVDSAAYDALVELAMDYSEAFKKTITSESTQIHLDKDGAMFQDVATLALFNFKNVLMCAIRKQIHFDEFAGVEKL